MFVFEATMIIGNYHIEERERTSHSWKLESDIPFSPWERERQESASYPTDIMTHPKAIVEGVCCNTVGEHQLRLPSMDCTQQQMSFDLPSVRKLLLGWLLCSSSRCHVKVLISSFSCKMRSGNTILAFQQGRVLIQEQVNWSDRVYGKIQGKAWV